MRRMRSSRHAAGTSARLAEKQASRVKAQHATPHTSWQPNPQGKGAHPYAHITSRALPTFWVCASAGPGDARAVPAAASELVVSAPLRLSSTASASCRFRSASSLLSCSWKRSTLASTASRCGGELLSFAKPASLLASSRAADNENAPSVSFIILDSILSKHGADPAAEPEVAPCLW